ncbi:MAG: phytoene desaturase family protein [Rhodothermales bacterium]|jgi:phytoene desaturase|nr:phytoene desaturase family protein [Rhodothermales bacterium]MDG2015736.1 phytoene desaturase family protein [Rhodothermales bacterium]HAY37687.1 phytoene desaturase [Bacteroidota bacterium]
MIHADASHHRVVVVGAGFSGLASAITLAQQGHDVTVVEKHAIAGGRARVFEADGYRFDMGPSWYWMPDVIETFFQSAGTSVSEHFDLIRLDPSYRVWYADGPVNVPAGLEAVRDLFEEMEPGSSRSFDAFMKEAREKYELGMDEYVWKTGHSVSEFANPMNVVRSFGLSMFGSLSRHVKAFFSSERIQQLLEFPVLFLGSRAAQSPALYSLMNHADIALGTWYPVGGMYELVRALEKIATTSGVKFQFDTEVLEIMDDGRKVTNVRTSAGTMECDSVIAAADYNFVEQQLLHPKWRRYSAEYWDSRQMSPGALIYYLGLDTRVPELEHHNLYFDVPFNAHADKIYSEPGWPEEPLFYAAAPSKTDDNVAPEGHENLFILVPLAAGLADNREAQDDIWENILDRLSETSGIPIRDHIVYRREYTHANFEVDYNAFKGNAYGLANTLNQTAFLKPKMRSKLPGLFFAGQLTTPGPGVPPSLISGSVAAREANEWLTSLPKRKEAASS